MKKNLGTFHVFQVGDWTILARMKKRIPHVHQVTGEPTSWFDVGGVSIRPNPKKPGDLLILPGTFIIDENAMQRHTLTCDPLMLTWLIAGALIGENFISYDKQPKFRGPRNTPHLVRRRKRIADFDDAVELWHSWLKWRLGKSKDSFEAFHLGPLEKYTAGKSIDAQAAAETAYISRCRAIATRLQGDYGLSLDRDAKAASIKAIKTWNLKKTTSKKAKTTKI